MTDDLVEFLSARIAEDKQTAHDGPFPGSTGDRWQLRTWEGNYTFGIEIDPGRVLAECEAKRKIIEHHAREPDGHGDPLGDTCAICSSSGPDAQGWPCATVRLLALPYADHPDEWTLVTLRKAAP